MGAVQSVCPECHSLAIIHYSGTRKRQCADCGWLWDWTLKEGKVPMAANNRLKKPLAKEMPMESAPEKEPFYSPCTCGNFVAKRSGQSTTHAGVPYLVAWVYKAGTGQDVCKNCGCMPPLED